MDNLYFLSHSIKSTSHPFILLLFHFHFPSSENVFHWNLFCDNIFISSSTLSVLCLLLAMLVNGFFRCWSSLFVCFAPSRLRVKMSQNDVDYFHCMHIHCPCLESSHAADSAEPNLLTQLFLPIFALDGGCGGGGEFTNLFTHRWINTFMRIDGYECKHDILARSNNRCMHNA